MGIRAIFSAMVRSFVIGHFDKKELKKMSFLLNLRSGIGSLLGLRKPDYIFEVRVKSAEKMEIGDVEYFGKCRVTPEFLGAFKSLCEEYECGEKTP